MKILDTSSSEPVRKDTRMLSYFVFTVLVAAMEVFIVSIMLPMYTTPLDRLSMLIGVGATVGVVTEIVGYGASLWLFAFGLVNLLVALAATLRALYVHVDGFSLAQ